MEMAQVHIRHRVLVFMTLRLRFQLPERLFILRCLWTKTNKSWSRCCTEYSWWPSFLEGPIHSFLFCLLFPPVSYLYTLAELEGRETK